MKRMDVIALALVVVGAVNWGLVAIAEFDLVAAVAGLEFGQTDALTRAVYGLVGASALWVVARASSVAGRRPATLSR
jgi:uncharacterized protein